jgi:hypothetical protein
VAECCRRVWVIVLTSIIFWSTLDRESADLSLFACSKASCCSHKMFFLSLISYLLHEYFKSCMDSLLLCHLPPLLDIRCIHLELGIDVDKIESMDGPEAAKARLKMRMEMESMSGGFTQSTSASDDYLEALK